MFGRGQTDRSVFYIAAGARASITQHFNTTTSMGRLTLNILLSFAQFEREATGERIRDKIAASKRRGMWMGGRTPLGYRVIDHKLVMVPEDAATVVQLYRRYLELGSVRELEAALDAEGPCPSRAPSPPARRRAACPARASRCMRC